MSYQRFANARAGGRAMSSKLIVPGLWEVSLGFVNAFLLESDDGLALIDTGVADSSGKILEAVRAIGRDPPHPRDPLPQRSCRQPGRTEAADRRHGRHAPRGRRDGP